MYLVKGLVALYVLSFASIGFGQHWHNRGQVLEAANHLYEEVRYFDRSLHNAHAPEHFIEDVHHFSETLADFIQMVQNYATYRDARAQFNHIQRDFEAIQREMQSHPELLRNRQVRTEWQHIRSEYSHLNMEMRHERGHGLIVHTAANHENKDEEIDIEEVSQ